MLFVQKIKFHPWLSPDTIPSFLSNPTRLFMQKYCLLKLILNVHATEAEQTIIVLLMNRLTLLMSK